MFLNVLVKEGAEIVYSLVIELLGLRRFQGSWFAKSGAWIIRTNVAFR